MIKSESEWSEWKQIMLDIIKLFALTREFDLFVL